jgi:tripartite-type tricarboxylate transporter receptor subunit TctC
MVPAVLETINMSRSAFTRFLLTVLGLVLSSVCQAQSLTSKPVTIVVPFQAGSPTDIVARALGSGLGEILRSPVIVENRPGASQTVAGIYVARSAGDGHTLLLANLPAVVAPSVQEKLPYAGIRDFAAISHVADVGLVLVTAPSIAANDLREFVALLRSDPSKYPYFSAGMGSPIHMLTELFNMEVGVRTTHVPYKGVPSILPDLMAGRVAYGFLQVGAMEHARTGKIKGLAIVARNRDPVFTETPTMAEAGLSNFFYTVPYVLVAPKGTPVSIVETLNAAVSHVISSDQFRMKLKGLGVQAAEPKSPLKSAHFIATEEKRWELIVKAADIKLE